MSEDNLSGTSDNTPHEGVHLTAEELLDAERQLSFDDRQKLSAIERILIEGTGRQSGELYREALTRSLLGTRRCPKHIPPIAFLIQTMKSIAYHDRARASRFSAMDQEGGADSEGAKLPLSDDGNPERSLIARQEDEQAHDVVETFRQHFEGDDEAQLLIMGWAEGLRGKELREVVGVDQAGLDYLIKRVRRAALKAYPKGWRP